MTLMLLAIVLYFPDPFIVSLSQVAFHTFSSVHKPPWPTHHPFSFSVQDLASYSTEEIEWNRREFPRTRITCIRAPACTSFLSMAVDKLCAPRKDHVLCLQTKCHLLSPAPGLHFSNSPFNSSLFTGSFPSIYRHYFSHLWKPRSWPHFLLQLLPSFLSFLKFAVFTVSNTSLSILF